MGKNSKINKTLTLVVLYALKNGIERKNAAEFRHNVT